MTLSFGVWAVATLVFVLERLAVISIPVAVAATIIWANVRMLRRARATGYRYWLVNPRSLLAAAWGAEFPMCFGAVLTGMIAEFALMKLA
jgi:hypothetical protein